jgi:hypothetical protein
LCAGGDDDVCSNDYDYSCRGNDGGGREILVDDDKNNKTKQQHQHNQVAEGKD